MVYAWVLVCLSTLEPAVSEPACLPACSMLACHKRCLLAYEFHAIPSLFLLRSSVSTFSCLLVRRHVYCGLFKGISLFSGNACIAASSELASVSIGHSKNVIGLNSLIRATITWDRSSELVTLLLLFNSKEDFIGLVKWLTFCLSEIDSGWSVIEESCTVLVEVLLIDNGITFIILASVEFPDGHWIDWLLQILSFQIS